MRDAKQQSINKLNIFFLLFGDAHGIAEYC
jgi:hypothetical protein